MIEEKVKLALRLKSTAFDNEVTGLIAAAKADLRLAGIAFDEPGENVTENITNPADDALIVRAIVLYCKAHFGYNQDSEKFMKVYDSLKCTLALASDCKPSKKAGDNNALE